MKNIKTIKNSLVTLLFAVVSPTWVYAGNPEVGNQFTYQGELIDNGSPANGAYDILIQLHVSESSNASIDTNAFDDVAVVDGLFTVDLDYGDSNFSGDQRFLRVLVRPGDSTGSYEALTPRQRINVTPYAIQSEFTENGVSPWIDNGGDISYADQVFVGTRNTVSSSQLTVQSAANESPLRVFVNGTTRLIVKENGGTSIGINSDAPDRGLFVRGDASQGLDAHGFVKAGLRFVCGGGSQNIADQFNNQNTGNFSVSDSGLTGQCNITTPFDVSNTFIMATTSNGGSPTGVTCYRSGASQITCTTYDPINDNQIPAIMTLLLF